MFSLKNINFFLLAALFAGACHFWQPSPSEKAADEPLTVENTSVGVPFATKEPEIYQTEILLTANGAENRIFVAVNAARRLTIYDLGEKSEFAVMQNGAGASFSIVHRLKIYAENPVNQPYDADDVLPTAELLAEKSDARYERLNTANKTTEYRVILDNSTTSESIVTVDENIKLPVKQAFYATANGQKTLLSTVELVNFKLQTDALDFEIPADYKKVSPAEFQEITRRERENE